MQGNQWPQNPVLTFWQSKRIYSDNAQPVSYASLNPGQSFTINTYVTQPWMFSDGPGNCIETFMPRKGVKRFNIKRKSTEAGGD
jgi:hypothetical protein